MGKKHKSNKIKKQPELRTRQERQDIVNRIITQLEVLGIWNPVSFPCMTELQKVMNNFLETGQYEVGKIRFPEANRIIEYRFTNIKPHESMVNLKSN